MGNLEKMEFGKCLFSIVVDLNPLEAQIETEIRFLLLSSLVAQPWNDKKKRLLGHC